MLFQQRLRMAADRQHVAGVFQQAMGLPLATRHCIDLAMTPDRLMVGQASLPRLQQIGGLLWCQGNIPHCLDTLIVACVCSGCQSTYVCHSLLHCTRLALELLLFHHA